MDLIEERRQFNNGTMGLVMGITYVAAGAKPKYAAQHRSVDVVIDPPDESGKLGASSFDEGAIAAVGAHLNRLHFEVLTVIVALNIHFKDGVFKAHAVDNGNRELEVEGCGRVGGNLQW